jgi:hypothetical protein
MAMSGAKQGVEKEGWLHESSRLNFMTHADLLGRTE